MEIIEKDVNLQKEREIYLLPKRCNWHLMQSIFFYLLSAYLGKESIVVTIFIISKALGMTTAITVTVLSLLPVTVFIGRSQHYLQEKSKSLLSSYKQDK